MRYLLVLLGIILVLAWRVGHPPPESDGFWFAAQSWDQENLKRNDHGCPTAIFIAPHGNLEQCK
jgi:hypothetical protein